MAMEHLGLKAKQTRISAEATSLPRLIGAMMRPDFYSHPCPNLELRQTLTSWLVYAGDFVYKIKKPQSSTSIGASTPAKRSRLCEREILLNRRLAHEVYLGVVGIAEHNGRYATFPTAKLNQADVEEFAIVMRRLPTERSLQQLVVSGMLRGSHIHELANRLAAFHQGNPASESRLPGSAQTVSRLIMRNLDGADALAADSVTKDRLAAARDYSRRYLISHRQNLNNRARDGYVRDGHGDLRCDSIYFMPQGIVIIGCLDHDERLRHADQASELASISVSLDMLERSDLADELVDAYSVAARDSDIQRVIRFYKCYRAVLGGRLQTLASLQIDLPVEQRLLARAEASRLFALGHRYAVARAKEMSHS
jgi:uncharacterized protein